MNSPAVSSPRTAKTEPQTSRSSTWSMLMKSPVTQKRLRTRPSRTHSDT